MNKYINFIYKNEYNFIYLMFIYHIIIVYFIYINVNTDNVKILFGFDKNFKMNIYDNLSIYKTLFFTLITMLFDLIFLIIIKKEIKELNLTYNKIIIAELLIFIMSVYNPFLRMTMLFLSSNTIQIEIFYIIIKNIPYSKYLFISGSIFLILKLIIGAIL